MAHPRAPTATAAAPQAAAGVPLWPPQKSLWRLAWGRLRRDTMALLGGFVLIIMVLLAVLAPYLAPHNPYEMDVAKRLSPPGTPGYLLGADEAGRDMLSRLMWGGRVSLVTAVVPVLAAALVAMGIGLVAGY